MVGYSGSLFGTDGIRGEANSYPVTCDVMQKVGLAAGLHFRQADGRTRAIIAKDTRLSGYMIEHALVAGLIASGVDVILVGPMPTASVSFLIKSLRTDFGIMITASHNPACDNGIKMFGPDGNKLCSEIQSSIEMLIKSDLGRAYVDSARLGRARRLEDAIGRYTEYVKSTFPKKLSLNGFRVVIDCANGAAYHVAPTVLWELGAEVIKCGVEPDGTNINLGCGAMHPELMMELVRSKKADLGIALDGDADRVVICDENGDLIHGDHVIAMIAQGMSRSGSLLGEAFVVTQMSNSGLEDFASNIGLVVHRANVGDRHVSAKMKEVGSNFGGEQSGHIMIGDYSSTGDGMIAALQVLALLAASGEKLSKISRPFALSPQIVRNLRFKGSNPLDSLELQKELETLSTSGDCKVFIRKSGTEKMIRIMVESTDKQKAEEYASLISEAIKRYV